MTTAPLSHHEIIRLAAPFTERGRQVDLAASDRLERRVAFRALERPDPSGDGPRLNERLALDAPETGPFRLTRTLEHPGGLTATLTLEGPEPGALIEQADALPPHHQFPVFGGVTVARSYRLEAPGVLVMTGAVAELPHLRLTLKPQSFRSLPAEIELTPRAGVTGLGLPPDLLAVLGWSWRPLRASQSGWRGGVRMSRRHAGRLPDIEHKLARTVRHLARTLARPPEQFHALHRWSRWRAFVQGSLGLLMVAAIFIGGPLILTLDLPSDSVLRMLVFHAPGILLVLFFTATDRPQLTPPPVPRPLPPGLWQPRGPGADPDPARAPTGAVPEPGG